MIFFLEYIVYRIMLLLLLLLLMLYHDVCVLRAFKVINNLVESPLNNLLFYFCINLLHILSFLFRIASHRIASHPMKTATVYFDVLFSTISFCCSAQIKCCRYLNGFCLSVVLVTLQACTFIAYKSDFCDKYNCSFSRTAGYSIGAIVCYLIAGTAFFLSSDYPGTLYDDEDDDGQDLHHEDTKLNPTEYAEARRISQQLGGTGTGASIVSSPAVLTTDYGKDVYNNEASGEYIPTSSLTAAAIERPIDDVESDKHPDVDAQY
jgi:hypothetical protein